MRVDVVYKKESIFVKFNDKKGSITRYKRSNNEIYTRLGKRFARPKVAYKYPCSIGGIGTYYDLTSKCVQDLYKINNNHKKAWEWLYWE